MSQAVAECARPVGRGQAVTAASRTGQAGPKTSGRTKGHGESRAHRKPKNPPIPVLSPDHLEISAVETRRSKKVLKVISSSIRVLSREGYAQFSMRSVAKESGTSLSSVQHYFATKDDLLFESVRIFIENYADRYRGIAYDPARTPKQAFEAIIQDIADALEDPEVLAIYFELWAMGRIDTRIGDLLVGVYEEYKRIIADLLIRMDLGLTQDKANEIAFLIVAQSEGLVVVNYHSGRRKYATSAIAAKLKSMWPVLVQLAVQEQGQSD